MIAFNAIHATIDWTMSGSTLIISGTDMPNYSPDNTPWYYQQKDIKKVLIYNGVTNIGDFAFYNCSNLTSITIPNTVTSIGGSAFYKCSGLTSITIPNSVKTIGTWAFSDCSGLTSIIIPNSVTSIERSAFSDCSGLTSITIPESVTSIGVNAFANCLGLASITIPNSVMGIGVDAFSGCYILADKFVNNSNCNCDYNVIDVEQEDGLLIKEEEVVRCRPWAVSVIIPNSVTSIRRRAFSGCSGLTSVNIPNSVKSIGDGAFKDCSGLTSINIPNSVTSIGNSAFQHCTGLASITISNSVTSIGEYAFRMCTSLASITIPNPVTSIEKYTFSGCKNLRSIIIPNSVTSIGEYAFDSCVGLTSITIPNSVTSIGKYAFCWCSSLISITIPGSVTSMGISAFGSCGITSVTILDGVTSIGDSTFSGCGNLTSVTIPNTVTCIGDRAFARTGFASLTIPESVTSIGKSAFTGCKKLKSVTIPNSVTSLGDDAFYDCSELNSITIGKGVVTSIKKHLSNFSGSYSVTLLEGVTSIGERTFEYCSGLKSITIPNTVTSIGGGAFSGCSGLTSVTIPNSVTSIGGSAFYDCSGLTSVTIPNSVTSIGGAAFSGCRRLGSPVTIGNSVESLGSGVFNGCHVSLICKTLTPPKLAGVLGVSVYVPASVVSEYRRADVWKEHHIYSLEKPQSVSIDKANENLFVGMKMTLKATIKPVYVDNTIVWTSSDTDVAIVSEEGVVTANSTGTTIITAKTYNGKTATCTITVKQPVTAITLSDAYASLYVGETKTLTATIAPADANNTDVKWSSSNVSVATVSSEGVITAKGKGTCTITCTAADGYGTKSTCSVTVEQPPITPSDPTESLWVGENKKIPTLAIPFLIFSSIYTGEWSSSDENVATVSSEGVITAKGKGTCTITCTVTKESEPITSFTVKVEVKEPVISIILSETSVSLWGGDTKTLTATATPTIASNTAVEWSSSDDSVATVSSEGVITANDKGSCTITCTAADGYGTKSECSVTVNQQVTEIALSETTASLWVGDTKFLTAKVTPTTANNTAIKWSSSDNKVATVSLEGMITAKGKGTCVITCTAVDGYGTKSTCEVNVKQQVTDIALSETTASLWVGDTKTLTATVTPAIASNTTVEWSSSNASIAIVSSEGVITAKDKGTCVITCTAVDGYDTKSTCEVTVKQQVKAITLRNVPTSLVVGDTKTVTTTVTPTTASNTAVEWSSSDDNVATISSRGVITAKGKGTCTITCTAADGYGTKTSFTITVKEPAISIALSETSASLWVGDTKIITATITPTTAGNTAITWSSSDDNVATVSSKGVITAKGKGTCTITCTAADGYSTKSECKVTVKQQVTSIDLGNETLILTCGAEKILIPTISPSNADVQAIAWTSTDKNVATISADGVLKALSPGTTKIICTATDGFNKESSITVNVVPFKISDDKPDIADGTYGEGGITYTRTMEKNKCDVFCMPYDVILSDYTDNFTKVYILSGMAIHKPNGTTLIPLKEVSLTETISAGQPFVAYAAKSGQVVLKNSSKVTIASLAEPNAIKLDVYDYVGNSITSNHDIDMTITGNYIKKTGLDKANNFVFSTNGTMTKATSVSPYRFYITKNDERSSAKISDIELSFDEDVTGIEELLMENDSRYIYNLRGQRINKSNIQKGVYIINGKKVVIK